MEEPVSEKTLPDTEPETHRRRRVTKHHPFHLRRAQRRLLARVAVFAVFVLVMLIVWYWMAVRG